MHPRAATVAVARTVLRVGGRAVSMLIATPPCRPAAVGRSVRWTNRSCRATGPSSRPRCRAAGRRRRARAPIERRLRGAAELLAGDDVAAGDERGRRRRPGRSPSRPPARSVSASAPSSTRARGRARRRPRAAARSRRSGGWRGRSCAGARPSRRAARRRTRTATGRPCRGGPRRAGSAGPGWRARRRRRTRTACRARACRAWLRGSSSKRVHQACPPAPRENVRPARPRGTRASSLELLVGEHVAALPDQARAGQHPLVLPRVLAVDEHRAGRPAAERGQRPTAAVVLPEPLRPSSPVMTPGRMVNDTASSAVVVP